jgi:hypothetical protein
MADHTTHPDPSAVATRGVDYHAEHDVTREGIGLSIETTSWAERAPEDADLDDACRAAALDYPGCIQSMSLGLIGPGEHDPLTDRTSLFIRPFGVKLLEVMRFGPLRKHDDGSYYFEVVGGLLRSRHEPERIGRLTFEWFDDGGAERFRTAVKDYRSRLVGRRANALQRAFYAATQMLAHRLVMWRYHVFVQRDRPRLLAAHPPATDDAA